LGLLREAKVARARAQQSLDVASSVAATRFLRNSTRIFSGGRRRHPWRRKMTAGAPNPGSGQANPAAFKRREKGSSKPPALKAFGVI